MRETKLALLALTILGLAACGDRQDATANNAVAPGNLPADALDNGVNAATDNAVAAVSVGATAALKTAQGASAGTARVSETAGALTVTLDAEGLPPGDHGVHIHMTGKCDGPKFESAGGHWNPAGMKHGLDNPQGQHAGDMPNLTIGPDGRGSLTYSLKGGTLAGLLDADGAAFVVHAKKDDQKTDPSGDSGDRIACGVFTAG
ncbi:MAG: superoxide dismutase [Sphingobium sp. 66-54]|nr:MAG: superoxide dismutase [Sphingobium sp. 66-54]